MYFCYSSYICHGLRLETLTVWGVMKPKLIVYDKIFRQAPDTVLLTQERWLFQAYVNIVNGRD